jgi:hypothetical protein
VDFSRIGRTGKNAATAMTHATRTTRLRMTHDGSMRFWERAGVFSLFFFFSASGTERVRPVASPSSLLGEETLSEHGKMMRMAEF